MASRKRGSVRVRGNSVSVVLDLGEHPRRKCSDTSCKGSLWSDSTRDVACERCGSPMALPILERKRVWRSGFEKPAEAKRALTAMLGDVDKGTFVEPSDLTLREFYERTWLPGLKVSDLRPTTRDTYTRSTRNYILPHLGATRLRDVTPKRIVQWLNSLKADRIGLRTVELAGSTLHKLLASAMDLELIARNPADNREVRRARPKARAPKPTVWSREQTDAFLDSQRGDRLFALWRLTVTTGLRRGEICGLRWSDIDFGKGSLRVSTTRVVVGWEVVESAPKTENSARTIQLDAQTLDTLREHKARQEEDGPSIRHIVRGTDFVFVDELGRPLHPSWLTRTFGDRAAKAGLPPVTFHSLRHGHATAGLEAGVPLPVMSKRLGHASIRITADTYQHVTAALDQDAADRVAAMYGDAL